MQKKLNVLSTFTLNELILINVTQMNTEGINHYQKDTRNYCPDFLSFNVLLGWFTYEPTAKPLDGRIWGMLGGSYI